MNPRSETKERGEEKVKQTDMEIRNDSKEEKKGMKRGNRVKK